jgi:hypothetical protein
VRPGDTQTRTPARAGYIAPAQAARPSWLIRSAVFQHGHAEHDDDQNPEQPGGPVLALDDLPGLLGGQQGGADGHGEPSGGLIDEAGELIALGLTELGQGSLAERVAAMAADQVHDRRQ